MTTVQTLSLAEDTLATIAAHITELVSLSQHLYDVQTASGGMSAILAAPGAAYSAEAYTRECARYEALCRQLYQDTQGVVSLGPATVDKLGLIKPGITMMIQPDGTIDVRQLVFALGAPVVSMTPKVATSRAATVTLSAPIVILPGATVAAYHVAVDGGAVQDVPAVNSNAIFTFTPAGAAGMTVTLKVTATDCVGNVSLETTATAEVVNGYVIAPTLLSPVAGAKIGTTSTTFITSAFSSFGIDDTHVSTEYRIRDMSGNVVYLQSSSTDLIAHTATAPNMVRGNQYQFDARHVGRQVGPSEWGPAVTVELPTVGHGIRVDGGIAIGDASGGQITFADGKKGYLVVTPASQRKASIKWGLYNTDTTLTNYTSSGFTDTKTGAQNTDVLTSSTYSGINDGQGSVGAPAATYCQNLVFEGCTDFFLPNYNELILVRTHKALIDSLDETGTENATFKLANWGFGSGSGAGLWCSSEYSSNGAWYLTASGENNYAKHNQFGVVAARRILVQ